MGLKHALFPPVDPAEQLISQHLLVQVGDKVVIDKDYPLDAVRTESFDVSPGTTGVTVKTVLTRTNAKGSTPKEKSFPFEPEVPEVPAPAVPGDVQIAEEAPVAEEKKDAAPAEKSADAK